MSDFPRIITTLSALLSLGLRDDLKGPRTAGSLSEIGIEELSDRPVTEFRPQSGAVEVARYFRVEAPELQGRLGAVRLADLPADLHPMVRITHLGEGHEFSFYLDRP